MDNEYIHNLTKILAVEMTARTGNIWRANIDPDRWTTQIYCDTAYIALSTRDYPKPQRLKLWPTTSPGVNQRSSYDHITLDPKRQPAQIAADIARRLLPQAEKYLVECKASQDAQDRQNTKEQLIRNLLQPYLKHEGMYRIMHGDNIKAEIRTNTVEMKIQATPSQALAICKLMEKK
jgi:hypothetical protein